MNLRIAIVGYGSIGRRHCEILRSLGIRRPIVVRRRESANPAFIPPDDAVVLHSVDQAIDSGVDLAIVCNPTSLHVATARQFVTAGLPVLIEKPIAARLDEAEPFVRETESAAATAGMAYCMRHHPAYALAQAYLSQARLGHIVHAQAWFESYLPDWHPWEDYRQSYAARADLGGGVLPTLDHEIDFILWCFGLPAGYFTATSRSGTLDADVDDEARVAMRYDGYEVEIRLSICQPQRRRGFEVIGDQGTLRFSFEQQRLELLTRTGAGDKVLWHEPAFDLNLMYEAMLRDVLEAVAAGRPMPIPVRAGLEALRVATCG
ncbi:MAG TPA: Gfo/Idh/MocA family oxidoreductase [Pirellulales bacterium]|nr:Gfo/Idh/MocA family oxidoreductase [Pirellulales bacterium]